MNTYKSTLKVRRQVLHGVNKTGTGKFWKKFQNFFHVWRHGAGEVLFKHQKGLSLVIVGGLASAHNEAIKQKQTKHKQNGGRKNEEGK
ncbi:MAG: hypothetical protein IKH23_09850 [Clostridiales bacterium]|nr:hypothetical protein [Clostridiales bacterium]